VMKPRRKNIEAITMSGNRNLFFSFVILAGY
jgi:hypothetical protein